MHRSMPVFPLVPVKANVGTSRSQCISGPLHDNQAFGNGLMGSKYINLLDPDIVETYQNLRTVLIFRESCIGNEEDLTVKEMEYSETMILRIQHCLISFASSWHFRKDSDVQNVCRIVLPMLVFSSQFPYYRETTVIESMVVQLWEVLSRLNLDRCWSLYPDLMIWAFLFGVYFSSRQPKRQWFLSEVSKRSKNHIDCQWENVRNMLINFFFIERLYGAEFKAFCEEICRLGVSSG